MLNCACPKCDAAIDIDIRDISFSGTVQHCSECKAKFWTLREGFTLRAYKKQGEIYCFGCGHKLGHEDICLHCGSLFPDYFVVQLSKPAQRKQQKASVNFKPVSKRSPEFTFEDVVEPLKQTNLKPLAYVAMAMLVVVLLVGGSKYYIHYQAKQKYSRDFVVALFGIKSGADLCLKNSTQISSTWKTTHQATAPRLSQKDLEHLEAVQEQIDKAMDKLAETPEEYHKSHDRLKNLYQVFLNLKSINDSSPASLDELSVMSEKLEKDFIVAAIQLRDGLPENLLNELTAYVNKYHNLRFLIEKS
jgi:hypothetical protein